MPDPLCFVLIPSGVQDAGGVVVDFDALYREILEPAIKDANLEPFRGTGVAGNIHRPATLENFLLSEFAIADFSLANASVFYQIGVRDALQRAAVLTYPHDASFPPNPSPSELFLYFVSANGKPDRVDTTRRDLGQRLSRSSRSSKSTLLEAVERPEIPPVDHTATDVFRDRVRYSTQWKERLKEARNEKALDVLRAAGQELDVGEGEAGVVVDLFLSFRALSAWSDMIALVDRMPPPLARSTMVQEQLALALNRAGQQKRAVGVLQDLIGRRGPSSETCGILGRIYKDQWEAAKKSGDENLAKARLEAAIEAYMQGFEADWRDPYPGINAATLMEACNPPDQRQKTIVPIVVYAVERSIQSGGGDYWAYATLLEAAVLTKERDSAEAALEKAVALIREHWEPETTARNLRLISEVRRVRGEIYQWADVIQQQLESRAARS